LRRKKKKGSGKVRHKGLQRSFIHKEELREVGGGRVPQEGRKGQECAANVSLEGTPQALLSGGVGGGRRLSKKPAGPEEDHEKERQSLL